MTTLRERLNNIPPEAQAFLDDAPDLSCPFANCEGWTYKDLPSLTREQFETFLSVVGDKELKFLSFSPKYFRGQMFISPEGSKRLKAYLQEGSTKRDEPDTSDIPEVGEDWFKKAELKEPR